jgi:hypothetical protein
VPKGKPWTKEEERTLIQLVKKRRDVDVIAKALGKTEDEIFIKMPRLGLEVVDTETNQLSTSSRRLPEELPSIEDVMKRLTVALEELEQRGLERSAWPRAASG